MKRKITFFEHRKIDSKNVIFRLIKIFKNFQNGLGNQFFLVFRILFGSRLQDTKSMTKGSKNLDKDSFTEKLAKKE